MPARLLLLAALAAAVLGCGSDTTDPAAGGCKAATAGRVALVAHDIRWDTDCLEARAGAVAIEIQNRDDGINHNLHLPDAPGSPATGLELGPSTDVLEVTLAAGQYEFVCDLHPNMVGTLTVADAGP